MLVDDFEKVERSESLSEQSYISLRQALMTGKISPGEKVTGRRIAKAMGVSLTPAREAIGRLIAEGGLILGTNQAALVPLLTREKFKEITEARILLECLLAENSIKYFSSKKIKEIELIQKRMDNATHGKDFLEILHINSEFHFFIYKLADMPTVFSIVESLWLQIGPTFNSFAPDYLLARGGTKQHEDAIEAIKNSDTKSLCTAISSDIKDASFHLLSMI